MVKKTGGFRLVDAISATVCVILIVEGVAPVAAIGNAQYFWWFLLFTCFFLPYGLVAAELGSTYPFPSGIAGWVGRAFGRRFEAREAWLYWIQYPLWVASVSVLCRDTLCRITGFDMPVWLTVLFELAVIAVVCLASLCETRRIKPIMNISTIVKVALLLALGALGIYFAFTSGTANPVNSAADLLPTVDGIPYISVIILCFMGFEVITGYAKDMKDPKREIPKALLIGGLVIAVLYLLSAFGISVCIPVSELSTSSGFVESYAVFISRISGGNEAVVTGITALVGVAFMFTLIVHPISWAPGVNDVMLDAGREGVMPRAFGAANRKGRPVGTVLLNGAVAGLMVIIAPFLPDKDTFMSLFTLTVTTLLLSYFFMFPAFLKLRRIDSDIPRVYSAPKGKFVSYLMTVVPMLLIVLSVLFSLVYPDGDGGWTVEWVPLIGTLAAVIAGEAVALTVKNRKPADKR